MKKSLIIVVCIFLLLNEHVYSFVVSLERSVVAGLVTKKLGDFVIRKLGPSGKPMLHFPQFATRKAAKDAARRAGKGNPIHDTGRKSGHSPHFHPINKNGIHPANKNDGKIKDGTHYSYPRKG